MQIPPPPILMEPVPLKGQWAKPGPPLSRQVSCDKGGRVPFGGFSVRSLSGLEAAKRKCCACHACTSESIAPVTKFVSDLATLDPAKNLKTQAGFRASSALAPC